MLIVLTSEKQIADEAAQINLLFENGLERLHLRKPDFTADGYRDLLKTIRPEFYKRIMLHEHHELCREFKLLGIHIQEQPRIDLGGELGSYVDSFKNEGYKVSSSFHEKDVIRACEVKFEYVLLSPVFSSISKQGYKGRGFDVSDLDEFIVGMGGINAETLQDAFDLGFRGIGVLGGIWNSDNILESFLAIYQKLKTISK